MTFRLEIETKEPWPFTIGKHIGKHGWRLWFWRFAISYTPYNLGTLTKLCNRGLIVWDGNNSDLETIETKLIK